MSKTYILFDGRACDGLGTSDASVLVVCESNKEARSYRKDFGQCACYSYDDVNGELLNEKHEWNNLP
jgi:hypothetical protein